ncbi:hypothetical protein [Sinimarinibacterium thermocellulolyticum]|uniref:Uncharacterized protein n=1 Tax=Sinimarinibacterium thermocellulolyticum TaxID=3170016 RepID=A0ABV2A983_9GAMM
MSGQPDPVYDDVGSLVNQLGLSGMRYREFGPRKPAVVSSAGPAAPAAPASPPTGASAAPMSPTPPAPPANGPGAAASTARGTPVPTAVEPPRLRSVSAASPLSFTFERLRRQAIGSAVRAPALRLDLPGRAPACTADVSPQPKSLREVFAALEAHAPRRS